MSSQWRSSRKHCPGAGLLTHIVAILVTWQRAADAKPRAPKPVVSKSVLCMGRELQRRLLAHIPQGAL